MGIVLLLLHKSTKSIEYIKLIDCDKSLLLINPDFYAWTANGRKSADAG